MARDSRTVGIRDERRIERHLSHCDGCRRDARRRGGWRRRRLAAGSCNFASRNLRSPRARRGRRVAARPKPRAVSTLLLDRPQVGDPILLHAFARRGRPLTVSDLVRAMSGTGARLSDVMEML